MSITDTPVDVADALVARLESQSVTLGLQDVHYGDQRLLPELPAVCVEPNTQERERTGTGERTRNDLSCWVLVYGTIDMSEDDRDAQRTQRTVDVLTDLIAVDLNTYAKHGSTLGGIITEGLCTRVEYGYAVRERTLLRGNRILFLATSTTML